MNKRLRRILEQVEVPALAMNKRWDLLAWNRAASNLLFDFLQLQIDERNLLWLIFTNPTYQGLFLDWRAVAREKLARFRCDFGCHAGEPRFLELIERLRSRSTEFGEWWTLHEIHRMSPLRGCLRHPLVGRVTMEMLFLDSNLSERGLRCFYLPRRPIHWL